ncbi:MAG: hypothetical protein ABSF34_06445 [Verrucomicrobiota bacterium]
MTQRQIIASIAEFANAQRGIKINVPDRGGALEVFHGQGQPIGGRLLRVEKNQVRRPVPRCQVFARAQLKKFVGRDDQMPISPGRKTISFIPDINRYAQVFQTGGDQIADLMKEIIAQRTGVERETEGNRLEIGFGGHGDWRNHGSSAQRLIRRLFLQAHDILVVVPTFLVVTDQFEVRQ